MKPYVDCKQDEQTGIITTKSVSIYIQLKTYYNQYLRESMFGLSLRAIAIRIVAVISKLKLAKIL